MPKKKFKMLNRIALWLITIGAINWLSVALLDTNIVETVLNAINLGGYANWIHTLVGAAGVWAIYLLLSKQLK